jgi:menaquinone-9 beta-reductase
VILSQTKTDVVVVGGGPAGLAAALAARQKDLQVIVIDCALPPIDKTCGEGLMPGSLAALRKLGVSIDSSQAYSFRGVRFAGAGVAVESDFPTGVGFGIRRPALHRHMIEQAAQAGVILRWGEHVTGISRAGVLLGPELIRCRWIIGADGATSRVRRWAGLDSMTRDTVRFGYRRHYHVAPWSQFMEIHWGDGCQIYVTPVGADQVCVALLSHGSQLRLDDVLPRFPDISRRLDGARFATVERGGISASRKLRRVQSAQVALIGDASGSVDAITGEGLLLAFQQAIALAEAMEYGDLGRYEIVHRRICRRPAFMADFILMLDRSSWIRGRVLRAMARRPGIFANILAMHAGELPVPDFILNTFALGYQMLLV